MDFSSVKEEAQHFVTEDQKGFTISEVDDLKSEIYLKSKYGNHCFCITCPSKDSSGWAVWSEAGNSQSVIQDVMDKVDFEQVKDITQILKAISGVVSKAETKAASSKSNQNDEDDDGDDDDESNEDEDDDDDYYAMEDLDAQSEEPVNVTEREEEEEAAGVSTNFFKSCGSPAAVSRLVKDLKVVKKESHKYGIIGSPCDDNLFIWDVKLVNIPTDTQLGKDLQTYQVKYKQEAAIELSVQFPPDYPYSPPFIRVVKPRFKFLTGHVTIGGSICMQMLTKSGWCPTNDIESILVQVRTEILSDPKASLDPLRPHEAYTEAEAKDAFQRMVKKYGWS